MAGKQDVDVLIVTYLKGEVSVEEQKVLLLWLGQSEENKEYFRSIKDAYDLGKVELLMKESDTDNQWNLLKQRIGIQKNKSFVNTLFLKKISSYAAVLSIGFLSMYFINRMCSRPEITETTSIETGVGQQSKITLPDGSVVWLNSCSLLVYNSFSKQEKRIVDLKGEAYFEIEPDRSKPFIVKTNEFNYEVTGTAFNVYAYNDDDIVSISLTEGTVIARNTSHCKVMKQGETLEYNKATCLLTNKNDKTDIYTSWRRGEIVFDKISFANLTKRLERIYNVSFIVSNQKLKDNTFCGSFYNYESLETVLRVINTSIPIKYNIDSDKVYID